MYTGATIESNSYELSLRGFHMPQGAGTASLRVIYDLQRLIEPIAQGAVRLAMTGNSSAHGRKLFGLNEATEFSLNDLRRDSAISSTILVMSAPKLGATMKGQQGGDLFASSGFDSLPEESALSVAMRAIDDAFQQNTNSPLLDRNLLMKMHKLNNFFPDEEAYISLSNQKIGPALVLTREKLKQLAPMTEAIPQPNQVTLVGKLDEMKHSTAVLLLILPSGEKVKVLLLAALPFEEVIPLFGQSIRVQGLANYNAAGRVLSIEAGRISAADGASLYFSEVHKQIVDKLDLARLKAQQGYRGTDIAELESMSSAFEWGKDESIHDILAEIG